MSTKTYTGVRKKGATWSYRFSIVVNGRTFSEEKSSFPTAYAAHQARQAAIAECKRVGGLDQKVKFHTVYEKFVNTEGDITRAYNTMLRYDSLYRNHLKPAFGNITMGNIRASDIQELIANLAKRYNSHYPRSIYNFLRLLFEFAYRQDFITHNTMDKVKPPATDGDKKVELPTQEEFKILQTALADKRVQLPFNIGLALGLRASETYGLRWKDFDFTKNEVHIERQLQSRKDIWCIAKPKTINSVRVIKFGENFSQYLQAMKRLQEEDRKREGIKYRKNYVVNTFDKSEKVIEISDFVNVKENGEFMTINSNKVIAKIAKQLGIKFKYHHLRHNYLSRLAENRVNPAVIMGNAGHSSARFTFSKYITPSETEKQVACEVIDKLIDFTAPTDL